MRLRIPVVEVEDEGAAVGAGSVETGVLLRGQAERFLPFFLTLEPVGVGIGVRRLVPHELHEPFLGLALDLHDHLAFELAEALVREKKGDEDGRDPDRHKPFVPDVAGRAERQPARFQFRVELLDMRLEPAAVQGKAQRGDLLFQQFLVGQVDPGRVVHAGHCSAIPDGEEA